MSFVEQDDVIAVNEGFLQRVFKEVLDVDIQLPLPRMTWQDAMDKYGSDKPDVRFGFEIKGYFRHRQELLVQGVQGHR